MITYPSIMSSRIGTPTPLRRLKIFFLMLVSLSCLSGAIAGDSLKYIARKLNESIKIKPVPTLAVLNFLYSRNRTSTGSYLVSERLVTYLVEDGAKVIERRLLERLLEERKFWETGVVEPGAMKKMGKVLGADAIVTGFLTDLSEAATEVLVRVVRVDTGEIIASASGVIQRVWADQPRLPRIAQPRSAVPMASVPLEQVKEPSNPSEGRGQAIYLRLRQHQKYYPVPIPFILPPAPQPTNRSSGR